MLDANEEGADWREVSRIALHIDTAREPDRARRAFDAHLARASGCRGSGIAVCSGQNADTARWPSAVDRKLFGACIDRRS